MAATQARNAVVHISIDGGTSWEEVSGMMTSVTIEENDDSLDVSAFGTGGHKKYIPGYTDSSVSWEGWDDEDFEPIIEAAQEASRDGESEVLMRVRSKGTGSGKPQKVFQVTAFQHNNGLSVSEAGTSSGGATISGAIDKTPQGA